MSRRQVVFQMTSEAMENLEFVALNSNLTENEVIDRAVNSYTAMTHLGWFGLLRFLWRERRTVRWFTNHPRQS